MTHSVHGNDRSAVPKICGEKSSGESRKRETPQKQYIEWMIAINTIVLWSAQIHLFIVKFWSLSPIAPTIFIRFKVKIMYIKPICPSFLSACLCSSFRQNYDSITCRIYYNSAANLIKIVFTKCNIYILPVCCQTNFRCHQGKPGINACNNAFSKQSKEMSKTYNLIVSIAPNCVCMYFNERNGGGTD